MSAVCLKRLQKELIAIQKSPVPNISTTPNESNFLEWHYVIEGPADSVYAGGYYHGILRFPKEYPYKPPSILMLTKNGRFKTNFRLCLSMSDYHPETWNPMWSVASILQGLFSFMLDNQPTLGSIESSSETRRALAKQSLHENLKNPVFRKLFPQYVNLPVIKEKSPAMEPVPPREEVGVVEVDEEEAPAPIKPPSFPNVKILAAGLSSLIVLGAAMYWGGQTV